MTNLCTAPCPGNKAQTVSPPRCSRLTRPIELTSYHPFLSSAAHPILTTSTAPAPGRLLRPRSNPSTWSDRSTRRPMSKHDPAGRRCSAVDRARCTSGPSTRSDCDRHAMHPERCRLLLYTKGPSRRNRWTVLARRSRSITFSIHAVSHNVRLLKYRP